MGSMEHKERIMRHTLSTGRVASVIVVLVLISAACAPIPMRPSSITPTVSVFMPGVGKVEPGVSPLQPTATLPTAAGAPTEAAATAPAPTATPAGPSPTPAPSLIGPTWEWVSSTFADGTVLASGDSTRYTFQLLGDGNAVVQADCNFGSGTFEAAGEAFSFKSIGTTKVACPPDSLSSAFVAQLLNTESARFEATELVLSLKEGAGTMRLQAAAEPVAEVGPTETAVPPVTTELPATPASPTAAAATPTLLPTATVRSATATIPSPADVVTATVLPTLNSSQWVLVSLTAEGQALPPVGPAPITLEIAADGSRISGSTGCNRFQATIGKDASGAAVLGPELATQNTCAPEIMVQEVKVVDALLRARSYVLQGSELRFIDSAGRDLLVFVRK